MFDYSYLNRISDDSRSLHLEVLELFCRVGEKNQQDILEGIGNGDSKLVVASLKDVYPSLRVLGMCGFIEEAEELESILAEGVDAVDESIWSRVQAFSETLAKALEHAAREIIRYKQSE